VTLGFISVGSNIDRDKHIASGLKALKAAFGDLLQSSTYESEAVGFTGDAFYNLVVGFNSELPVMTVAQLLRQIEIDNGRKPDSQKFSARSLDLDLILYGNLVTNNGKLQLPRPDIEIYAFVLEPLAEIAPSLIHPVLRVSYAALWEGMDKSKLSQRRIGG